MSKEQDNETARSATGQPPGSAQHQDTSVVDMVMGAMRNAQRRLAEQSAKPVGNMSKEYPPYSVPATPSDRGPNQDQQVHLLLRKLVHAIDRQAALAVDDAGRAFADAQVQALADLARPLLGQCGAGVEQPSVAVLAPRPVTDLDALARLAEAAGGDDWNVVPTPGDAEWYVWRADGDAACKCLPNLTALPEAISARDTANFIAAVSPAKTRALVLELTRAYTQMQFFANGYAALLGHGGTPAGEAVPAGCDLDKCPSCGGPADNGHSREVPPSPYYCTKCARG